MATSSVPRLPHDQVRLLALPGWLWGYEKIAAVRRQPAARPPGTPPNRETPSRPCRSGRTRAQCRSRSTRRQSTSWTTEEARSTILRQFSSAHGNMMPARTGAKRLIVSHEPHERPPISMYLGSTNSSKPMWEPSRPRPLSFTPPKGATSVAMTPSLMPTMP